MGIALVGLTSYAILLGAEINAEAEAERGAVKADTLPPDDPEEPDTEQDRRPGG